MRNVAAIDLRITALTGTLIARSRSQTLMSSAPTLPSPIQYTFAIRQPRLGPHARGLVQSVFSPPPRLATSRLDLKMIRRVAGLKTLRIRRVE